MVVLVPANSLAPSVTVNPEMCCSIDVSFGLGAIMVQSIETVKGKVKQQEKEKSCYILQLCASLRPTQGFQYSAAMPRFELCTY